MLKAKGRETMIYLTRTATVIGGREGEVTTPNQSLHLKLAKPQEMGGKPNSDTNPEELFISGYIACLSSSFEFLSGKMGMPYESIQVEGQIDLKDHATQEGFQFAVHLTFTIEGLDDASKEKLVEQTFLFCPFSRAIKGNVDVAFTIQ
jgi:lipoyl-dependent peroxiredoxin